MRYEYIWYGDIDEDKYPDDAGKDNVNTTVTGDAR